MTETISNIPELLHSHGCRYHHIDVKDDRSLVIYVTDHVVIALKGSSDTSGRLLFRLAPPQDTWMGCHYVTIAGFMNGLDNIHAPLPAQYDGFPFIQSVTQFSTYDHLTDILDTFLSTWEQLPVPDEYAPMGSGANMVSACRHYSGLSWDYPILAGSLYPRFNTHTQEFEIFTRYGFRLSHYNESTGEIITDSHLGMNHDTLMVDTTHSIWGYHPHVPALSRGLSTIKGMIQGRPRYTHDIFYIHASDRIIMNNLVAQVGYVFADSSTVDRDHT